MIEKSNLGGPILNAEVESDQPNVATLTLGRVGLNHGIASNGLSGDGYGQISEGFNGRVQEATLSIASQFVVAHFDELCPQILTVLKKAAA